MKVNATHMSSVIASLTLSYVEPESGRVQAPAGNDVSVNEESVPQNGLRVGAYTRPLFGST